MHDDENYRYVAKNRCIDLTPMENSILAILIKNKGNLVTFETLCLLVYKEMPDIWLKNNLRTHMARLRKKLKGEIQIMSKRDKGYYIY